MRYSLKNDIDSIAIGFISGFVSPPLLWSVCILLLVMIIVWPVVDTGKVSLEINPAYFSPLFFFFFLLFSFFFSPFPLYFNTLFDFSYSIEINFPKSIPVAGSFVHIKPLFISSPASYLILARADGGLWLHLAWKRNLKGWTFSTLLTVIDFFVYCSFPALSVRCDIGGVASFAICPLSSLSPFLYASLFPYNL